jgi:hypothetical protein
MTSDEATFDLGALATRVEQSSRVHVVRSGVTSDVVTRAELRLGVPFSATYKWFLLTFGGGDIGGHELNGLAEIAHTEPPQDDISEYLGDIVSCHELNVGRPGWNVSLVEIVSFEGDEIYCFDTHGGLSNGEYPIVVVEAWDREHPRPYAKSFADFLWMMAS